MMVIMLAIMILRMRMMIDDYYDDEDCDGDNDGDDGEYAGVGEEELTNPSASALQAELPQELVEHA